MKKIILAIGLLLFPALCFSAPEIVSKRTYNQKVYDLGGGKQNYKIHTAHINYKDDSGNFQEINTCLAFDNTAKQWKHSKASYNPTIPEYADGVFDFRNRYEGTDFTLKFKPVASHVKGTYCEAEEGNYVLYPNAFGQDIDLKVYSYWAGIKKVICINKTPADLTKDLTFDFEIVASSLSGINILNKDDTAFDFSKASAKLDFTDKTIRLGKEGKFTYFRNALMWDSAGLTEKVDIQLVRSGAKLLIRKTIPAEFLQKAVFPVYTDHPTSYYAGNGSGNVIGGASTLNLSWDTVHDLTVGNYIDLSSPAYLYVADFSGVPNADYIIVRGFFPVDTSGIDDSSIISSAILYIYVPGKENSDNDGDDWINLVQTSQNDPTTLTTDDFEQCGTVDNPTEGATRIDISNITTSQYTGWTLNNPGSGTGCDWISKTDYTLLGMREGHDCLDLTIVTASHAASNSITLILPDDTSGTKDPYLDVTVVAGVTAPTSTILGGCQLGGVTIGR